ncbi:MAG: LL-diaminopimelate aminotransferase [Paludibacter sp.]|jgi:LL-diaminopimelate aminotransferase|nr:LL-diaminopimelate aminotransferase [Paludibacter sp.]
MALVNENYLVSPETTYAEDIERQINAFRVLNVGTRVFRFCDVSPVKPLLTDVSLAMNKAVEDLSLCATSKGHIQIQGNESLIDKIIKDYSYTCGVRFDKEAIFINSGLNSDFEGIMNVLGENNIVAITAPVDATFDNTIVLTGRAGLAIDENRWSNLVQLKCDAETNFVPLLPQEHVDVIFLSNPNSVTGTVLDKTELKRWVNYATENQSIIIYDASFQAYINDKNVPRSIYEIKGAKRVAIEMRSYSKNVGFAGLQCGFVVMPTELQVNTLEADEWFSLNKLWKKRISNLTNGVSHVSQCAAEALYTQKSKREIAELVNYYNINASLIREELLALKWKVYGGTDSPFVWFKIPNGKTSWKFFNLLLFDFGIAGTPGIVFGAANDNYMRFSAFAERKDIVNALAKLKKAHKQQ